MGYTNRCQNDCIGFPQKKTQIITKTKPQLWFGTLKEIRVKQSPNNFNCITVEQILNQTGWSFFKLRNPVKEIFAK